MPVATPPKSPSVRRTARPENQENWVPAVQPVTRRFMLKRFAIALLVTILTFAGAEALTRCLVVIGKPVFSYDREFDRKYALAQTPVSRHKEMMLLLGDSKMDHGLFPEQLAARLSDAGHEYELKNLAVSAGSPNMAIFMLKTAMKANPKKHPVVIFDVEPKLYVNTTNKKKATDVETRLLNSYTGRCYFQEKRTFNEKALCSLEKGLYLVRSRKALKEYLTQIPDSVFETSHRLKYPRKTRSTVVEVSSMGWSPAYQTFSKAEAETLYKAQIKRMHDETHFTGWDFKQVKPLFDYCHQHHIPLVLVWMPELFDTVHMKTDEGTKITSASFENKLSQLANGQDTYFLSLFTSDKNPSHYYHSTHINVLGSVVATDKVADFLLTKGPFQSKTSPPVSVNPLKQIAKGS